MKKFVALLLVVLCVRLASAAPAVEFPLKWPPLEGWRTETIPFPLDFCPQLKFTGVEELRFAPGFRDPKAIDYFTYAFAWLIDERPAYVDWKLPSYLRDYFAGLMASVNKEKKWPRTYPTRAAFSTEPSPYPIVIVETWDAFYTGKPLRLTVHVTRLDTNQAGKRLMYFEASPNMQEEKVRRALAGVRSQLQP